MFEQPKDVTPILTSVGHWTDAVHRTGCTAILFDRPARAVADIRGGGPGTRETTLLGPDHLVQFVDAILLSGGSAFGLGAADGVVRYLAEQGRGIPTPARPVPIVPAAVLYDLSTGSAVWPGPDEGYAAAKAAGPLDLLPRGDVGAGTGATTAKLFPGRPPEAGGIGMGSCEVPGRGRVTVIIAVNAAGAVVADRDHQDPRPALLSSTTSAGERTNTSLTVVLVDAPSDERSLRRIAIAAHDGMARRIVPCHTIFDGDIVFAVGLRAGGVAPAQVFADSVAAELAVERAIVDAIDPAHRRPA